MRSKEEIDEEARLKPWFRYAKEWPDFVHTEMVWLLAHSMLAIHKACLVGNPAPVVQEMYERMKNPQVGDVVLEHTTSWHKDWPERALGRLTAIEPDPIGGNYYLIAPFYFGEFAMDAITRWENASIIALPVNETDYLGKPQSMVFTKDSLVAELSDYGFELNV